MPPAFDVEELSMAELQAALADGRVTSVMLVDAYAARIAALDRQGPELRAVQELNPDAPAIARALDDERRRGSVRGPLHGIPVLLKDNIATADRMETTAGTLSLVGARVPEDAFVAARLRAAGAVILGKASMTEWANFKGAPGLSGWSARNGQGRNPYALDRSPRGSSSGSAIAVAASLVGVAVGTETDGSIVAPAGGNGVVGIKPTVGLTSRTRVIPISATQDTIGPFGRSVTDAALLLGAMTGVDPADEATMASEGRAHTDYTRFLDAQALRGARLGVPRAGYWGYSAKTDAVVERALVVMRGLGAHIVDPVDIPHFDRRVLDPVERTVMLHEFKAGVNAYLAGVSGAPVKTLSDVIAFNRRDPAANLPFTGQELLERADATGGLDTPEYLEARETCARLGRGGLDAVFAAHRLDALVAPTTTPAWPIDVVNGDPARESAAKSAAMAGYPLVSVPAGMVQGLPVGLTFMGPAWSEPMLIGLAFAFEQATRARVAPTYRATV